MAPVHGWGEATKHEVIYEFIHPKAQHAELCPSQVGLVESAIKQFVTKSARWLNQVKNASL